MTVCRSAVNPQRQRSPEGGGVHGGRRINEIERFFWIRGVGFGGRSENNAFLLVRFRRGSAVLWRSRPASVRPYEQQTEEYQQTIHEEEGKKKNEVTDPVATMNGGPRKKVEPLPL